MPLAIFLAGAAALGASLGGTLVLQVFYALFGGPLTAECRASLTNTATGRPVTGALGVCHIFVALTSSAQDVLLLVAVVLGMAAALVGWRTYKRMPTRRTREHAVAGAVLGVQGLVFALIVLWFSSGKVLIFARNFLNFTHLEGYVGRYITVGAKNTLLLAFIGETGGILVGLILAVFVVSKRRVVRAPAIAYINFFRGTPLIWQLVFFSSVFTLGFGVWRGKAFSAAALVLILNTGAYAAEVFRAGIQSIERGQMEAARSLGMTYFQAMRYAIVPQAVRRVIPPLMNEFVILIKDTALVSVLGLSLAQLDIFSLSREGRTATFNATFMVAAAVAYLVITLPLIWAVNRLERRLRSGLTGVVGAGG